jgi:hypothetical protein
MTGENIGNLLNDLGVYLAEDSRREACRGADITRKERAESVLCVSPPHEEVSPMPYRCS